MYGEPLSVPSDIHGTSDKSLNILRIYWKTIDAYLLFREAFSRRTLPRDPRDFGHDAVTRRVVQGASVKSRSVCQSRVESRGFSNTYARKTRMGETRNRMSQQTPRMHTADAYGAHGNRAVIIINMNQKVHSVRGASCSRNNAIH